MVSTDRVAVCVCVSACNEFVSVQARDDEEEFTCD